jgi:regulator of extracellular matrix RemA (YlzA/DUF370 family)
MGKTCPRKFRDLQNIVEEFRQLESAFPDRSHLRRLLDGSHVDTDLVDATAGRSHM